ncbi:hypothetical protein SODALDRAFT_327191 [Sodiomyces alkalinus F11]|uniref:Uncharacterized protein n=1 Tax=Sodiomyces alkalinus (strain CBS 110278 / VKM F-3762 / F11) TaxID=1314773 RepID=A0A3N2Q8K2_SODAK|nr:hypothetical protein SODALDRAFT_327191 [Sodiomyces alkalinus F11]ROT43017.1 hypothetical protein SODALDRAFT_327191 [Sodiomyces alkalinus F11]
MRWELGTGNWKLGTGTGNLEELRKACGFRAWIAASIAAEEPTVSAVMRGDYGLRHECDVHDTLLVDGTWLVSPPGRVAQLVVMVVDQFLLQHGAGPRHDAVAVR